MGNRIRCPGLGLRVAAAVAACAATAVLLARYGAADTGPVPPPGAVCNAPLPARQASAPTTGIRAQIRYDGGLVLRYCSVAQMAAQLRALEQPGLVRAVYVLSAAGVWQVTPAARYLRRAGATG